MPPKRTRRFQGLYYHSSPPKVISMDGHYSEDKDRKRRDVDDFSIKLSTIRIWMHEKDIKNLTRVLWAGQGAKLRQQASTNPRIKRFLAAVPYVMNAIKDVHRAVVDNNLETLQAKLEPPVPTSLVTCRDSNGLNIIHKAAGLGHTKILEYLIGIWPEGAHETDITGKTPLHWAASARNNMRCYTLLTDLGCNEDITDYKMRTPAFYRHKSNEIERAFLTYVPDAPRVSPDIETDWDALREDNGDGKKPDVKTMFLNGPAKFTKIKQEEPEMFESLSEEQILNRKDSNKQNYVNQPISETNEDFGTHQQGDVGDTNESEVEILEPEIVVDEQKSEELEVVETTLKSPLPMEEFHENNSAENEINRDEVELETHNEKTDIENEEDKANNDEERKHGEMLVEATEKVAHDIEVLKEDDTNVELTISSNKNDELHVTPEIIELVPQDENLNNEELDVDSKISEHSDLEMVDRNATVLEVAAKDETREDFLEEKTGIVHVDHIEPTLANEELRAEDIFDDNEVELKTSDEVFEIAPEELDEITQIAQIKNVADDSEDEEVQLGTL